jgi:nucleotide-binding universal stress UspA family protein
MGLSVFTHAIVATDLGPASEVIVACASTLRTLGVRHAVLVHVIDLEHTLSPGDDATFTRQVTSLESAGIRVSVDTPFGYAAHAITEMAAKRGAGLIVMGTRGQGLFHIGFSGSVSSDVIRLSPVPVLLMSEAGTRTARGGAEACGRALASVLLPTDFSASADRTFRQTCALAPAGIDRLTIVPVIQSTFEALRGGSECVARDQLDALSAQAREAGVADVRTEVAVGDPNRVIAKLTASDGYSMVILAPRCLDSIDQHFGSVTNAVIRESTIPMLLTRWDTNRSATCAETRRA